MTTCSICLDHLEQPVCCIPCGHLFCNQCFSDWRNRHNNQCPECREPFTTVQSIYLDTESIKVPDSVIFIDERTRLNDSVNELTRTIENLRQNPSNEDQKVLKFVEKKDNFERAEATCKSLPIQKSNSVARFATIIFLIFTSVCFLYLGVCIFTEWFSEKPEFLDDVVVRHLEFLSGSSTYITSTFLSAATYVDYFYSTYTQAEVHTLPPTSNAAQFHILRAFYQMKVWIGEDVNLNVKDWGWLIDGNMYLPVRSSLPPAPEELLKTIYCRCKCNCDTKRCNCRKHGLECSVACTECRGTTCCNGCTPIYDSESDD
ncbi:unnamed protein product [Mytilus edulis]|uniref:RING-type domain-containing protein n=1 Tax=Mytilus edulis TaxID=6550 RepID=A0A8S3RC73_MYTED|nr:unnamed protein product [Mytilus edulis]